MAGPTQRRVAEAWLKKSISLFVANASKLQIRDTGEFLNSFFGQLISDANGDVTKIELVYDLVGFFQDLGVGKGQGIGEIPGNTTINKLLGERGRRPRKWFNKTMAAQTKWLTELMAENFGNKGMAILADNLPDKVIFNG